MTEFRLERCIAELRILVGFLGEKGQFNWWSSDFFTATAVVFLEPIFNRSLFLAQYQGATAAAAKVHDEAIGVGRIYHLFRLPIGLEQALADALSDPAFTKVIQVNITSQELAIARLKELAADTESASPGAVSLGEMSDDIAHDLRRAASFYHAAFCSEVQSFPYVREAE